MEERDLFKKLLKPIQRQLFFELLWKEVQLTLAFVGLASCLLLIYARFFVIPFLGYYFLILLLLAIIIFSIKVWRNYPPLKKAAFVYNGFVPEDRVITSYHFLEKEGVIASLQLADTVNRMKCEHEKVLKRKKRLFYPKWLVTSILFLCGAALLFYLPSEKFELAKQKENEIKLVAEEKEKLKEQIEKEKDPIVKKKLEEVQDKLATMKSAEKMLKELKKQSKELELAALKEKEKQAAFDNWKAQLNNNGFKALNKMIDEQNLKAIEKELSLLKDKWNELSDEQKKAFSQLTQQEGELSEEELAQALEQIEKALESEAFLQQLVAAQTALQNAGLALQNQMTSNGTPPSQIAFSPAGQGQTGNQNNGTSGQQGGNNGQGQQQGQGGQGTGNGNGSSNGSGSGSSSGSGSGSGTGSGSGSGTGNGSGGSGAGKGQGSRELLTIPEYLDGQTNIENDSGSIGEGKPVQQTDGAGLVLKGSIRPYSEVYSTYEKAYRQSTDRYKYPADLEEIVKNYFSTIDPNKE